MEQFFNRLGSAGMGLLALGVIGTRFVFVVDGGERVVIFNKFKGVQPQIYGEGMHFKIPVIMIPKRFEVRSRYRVINSTTGTRDLQKVDLTLRVLFRPQE
jgi:prohibitin 1